MAENKTEKTGMEYVGIFLSSLIGIILSVLLGGWVFQIIWGWFIVPIFNAPQLTIIGAIGIKFVIAYLQPTSKIEKKWHEMLLSGIFAPLFLLLLGFIIHQFQ